MGTLIAEGKESREFDGETYIMERAITGDFGIVKAQKADTFGNLVFEKQRVILILYVLWPPRLLSLK